MIEELSKITTVPILVLKKLFNNLSMCICHQVLENYLNKQVTTSCDIGIGKLNILIDSENIHYKFIPNSRFEASLIDTIKKQESPLVNNAEDILVTKVLHTYKDLM